MTDVAVPTESTAVAVPATPPVLPESAAIVVWAEKANYAYAIATKLANTSFVPTSMRGKPGDVTGALLAAEELGMPPMAALRSIDVIQGTPGLRAHAMRALVQSHGHEVEMGESSDTYCLMRGRRLGKRNWQTVEWTIARAAKMGLTGKAEWKRQPKTMLQARATGEICRLIAADVLHAMPYASEELDGYSSVPERTAAPTAKAEPPAVPGEVTLAELTGGDDVREDAPLVAEEPDDEDDEPERDEAWVHADEPEWPEVVTPGSGGAR